MVDKPLGFIRLDEAEFIESLDLQGKPSMMEPTDYPQEIPDIEDPVEEDIPESEQQKKAEDALMEAFWGDIQKQGLEADIRAAFKEFKEDLYLGSIRDKVFAFRPLYWDERLEIDKAIRDNTRKNFTPEDLVRKCVVVGLDNVIGPRARAGIWEAIAMRIEEVGDYSTDLPPSVNPPANDLPM